MNKKKWSTSECLIGLILGLLVLMLVVVVHDRYVFHKFVYNKAVCEVALLKKAKKSCPCSCKCRHYVDSIAKPLQNRSSAEVANTNNIRQTVNVNSNSSSLSKVVEDASSLFSLMKDVDGLISANGLTFLISLIVALLIALVTDRMGAMEILSSQITRIKNQTDESFTNNEKLQKEVQKSLEEIKKESEITHNAYDELQKEVQQSVEKTKKKTTDLYNHLASYDKLLVRIESLFNLAITIGNFTRLLSLLDFGNTKTKNSLSTEIGTLCSRLSLLCDSIGDIFITSEKKIDYLSKDEKNILFTYLLDAKVELKKSRKMVRDNENLYYILGDCRRMIENIYDKIESVETPND